MWYNGGGGGVLGKEGNEKEMEMEGKGAKGQKKGKVAGGQAKENRTGRGKEGKGEGG